MSALSRLKVFVCPVCGAAKTNPLRQSDGTVYCFAHPRPLPVAEEVEVIPVAEHLEERERLYAQREEARAGEDRFKAQREKWKGDLFSDEAVEAAKERWFTAAEEFGGDEDRVVRALLGAAAEVAETRLVTSLLLSKAERERTHPADQIVAYVEAGKKR